MIGFTKIYIDAQGNPSEDETQWIGDAFCIFGFVIYIGKVRHKSELE